MLLARGGNGGLLVLHAQGVQAKAVVHLLLLRGHSGRGGSSLYADCRVVEPHLPRRLSMKSMALGDHHVLGEEAEVVGLLVPLD